MAFHVQAASAFTRPSDTTAYASGDLVANSTTAGSVAAMQFSDTQRVVGGSGLIRRARVWKSGTSTTNASFRVHLYGTDPSASSGIANGDNGAWSTARSRYIGSMDVTMDKAFTDGAQGTAVPNEGIDMTYHIGANVLYGLLEARAAYTPSSGETFTVELEVVQDS